MKLNVSKKNILILLLVFCMVFCISGLCGYLLWRNNLSVNIDSEATYVIGEADLTILTQYTELTETFLLSFIFTFYGLCIGFVINTLILMCFIFIRLIIDNQGYYDYKREYKKQKYIEKQEKKTNKTRNKDEKNKKEEKEN